MTEIERDNARDKFPNSPQKFKGAIGVFDCILTNMFTIMYSI